MSRQKIGLALSGGGSRAIAFHLGCLRALHELGILDRVEVISTVSGGSVIGALYAAKDQSFEEFESETRNLLRQGLFRPAIRVAIKTTEGLKAIACWLLLVLSNLVRLPIVGLIWFVSLFLSPRRKKRWRSFYPPLFVRFASRTTILRRVLDNKFSGIRITEMSEARPLLIINAADLRTGSAFYFSRSSSGSWRLGKLADNNISLSHAVTASAAYPLFLPVLDETIAFDKRDGSRREERVNLTDGGVYDNLGLAPLWPDRDPSVSLNVSELDTIICCRAGYGLRFDPPSQFLLARLKNAFFCVYDRTQNAAIKRLFDLKEVGKLQGFIVPYLGQDDNRLKYPPTDLISRETAYDYPTDFFAMPDWWIDRLSRRGEQLTKALIREHMPTVVPQESNN